MVAIDGLTLEVEPLEGAMDYKKNERSPRTSLAINRELLANSPCDEQSCWMACGREQRGIE